MIRIPPDVFRLAGRLGSLCREPGPGDGPKSWLRSQQLAFDGGHWLTFRASDFRVGVVSRFRVSGADAAWERRVARSDYRRFTLVAEGGHFGVNSENPSCVRIEKDHVDHNDPLRRVFEFRYPLCRVDADAPFPGFSAPPDEADWAVERVARLRTSLRFLTPRGTEADGGSRMSSCAFLTGRVAVSWAEGAFLRAAGPAVSERIDLYRPDAGRLERWLGMVGEGAAEVRLSVTRSPDGRRWLLAATPEGDHLFQAGEAPRPLPVETVQRPDGDGPGFEWVVPRVLLSELAGVVTQYPACKIELRSRQPANGACSLSALCRQGSVTVGGPVAVVSHARPPADAEVCFTVVAEHARLALDRFGEDHVVLRYRPSLKCLVVAGRGTEETAWETSDRAYLRTGRVEDEPGRLPTWGTLTQAE